LLSKLNGHKVLIIGNHDCNHNAKFWRMVGY
jgi:calcineurin-like phosphoesterase family protein